MYFVPYRGHYVFCPLIEVTMYFVPYRGHYVFCPPVEVRLYVNKSFGVGYPNGTVGVSVFILGKE